MQSFLHQALAYNLTGQLLQFYPPQGEILQDGAPTSGATVTAWAGVQSNDETPKVAASSATLDSVSTTVNAATGYSQTNRTRVYLASTSGIKVGRRYLLENSFLQRELCVTSSVQPTYVEVEEPLAYDYATDGTSTFKGLLHTFTIPSAFIQDAANINVWGVVQTGGTFLMDVGNTTSSAPPYRTRWAYTTGSTSRVTWTSFDVHRSPLKTSLSLTDLREILPDVHLYEWLGQRGQDFQPQLNAAERDVRIDLRLQGFDPDAISDPLILNRLILQKWAVLVGKAMSFSSGRTYPWLDQLEKDYTNLLAGSVGSALRTWVDTGTTGAVTPQPARQMLLRGR